jgi:TonB-dependent starch-binding outer membrane protein SusC
MGFVFILLLVQQAIAQDVTISGKVTDKQGNPIPGASVYVKGNSSNGIATDANGGYTLKVPAGATLVITAIDYTTQEVAVGNKTFLSITLEEDKIEDIIVTGYRTETKREVTGAITQIKGDVIQNLPMQSFDRAIQGRMSGVLVQGNSGTPGGGITVRIRGTGSLLAGNDPLYIVDGVQMNTRNDAFTVSSNPLAFLNPNDIESVEVLQDAAAASIYGAQAANGVILVTTKRGKAGKAKFNFNYYKGFVEPIAQLPILSSQQYRTVRVESLANQAVAGGGSGLNILPNYMNEIRFNGTVEQLDLQRSYNWQNENFQYGNIDNYEMSISGGSDKLDYYVSGSFNRQDANTRNVDFKRGTFKANIGYQASDKFKLETNLSLSSFTQNAPFSLTVGNFLGDGNFSSPLILPMNPIYLSDGSFNGLPPNNLIGILNQNVIANYAFNKADNVTNQAVANLTGTYSIAKGLTFRSLFGIDYRTVSGRQFRDPRTQDAFNRQGLTTNNSDNNVNWITTQTLNYSKSFAGKHSINALLGAEYRQEVNQGISLSADFFPTPDFTYPDAAANPLSTNGFWTSFKRAGTFANVKYDYDKKYIFSATVRYDGSSRFGIDNRWGAFPSLSAAWVISEENFLKGNNFLSELKLRASWGQTGNDQVGNFVARGLYGAGIAYSGQGGIRPTVLNNPNLGWEINETSNIALDFGLFKNRIRGNVDAFIRTTKDLLLNRPLPVTSGFTAITQNVGEVQNRGVGVTLGTTNLDTKGGFKWTTDFNITFIRNEVTKLFDNLEVLPGDLSVRVGHPIGTLFTNEYIGVNPATGRPMYNDRNGNIIYAPIFNNDAKVVGDGFAELYGGLTNTVSYKGFELSGFFQYEFGKEAFNGLGSFMYENGGRQFNSFLSVFEDRWVTPGQVTYVPRPFNGNTEPGGAANVGGTRTMEDASYIRLKQLTLAYTLQPQALERTKFSSVRIYAQAINLLTFTKWQGLDPEFVGGNNNIIPQSRQYTVGLQFGF